MSQVQLTSMHGWSPRILSRPLCDSFREDFIGYFHGIKKCISCRQEMDLKFIYQFNKLFNATKNSPSKE